MSTNELIENLKTIEQELNMKTDAYIEMVNSKFRFDNDRPLRHEDVYPYKVGSAAAAIGILIDKITIYGIEEVNRNE